MVQSVAQVVEGLLFLGVAAGLLWFLWRVVVLRILRARHIRQLQMDRLIRESLARQPRPDNHQK